MLVPAFYEQKPPSDSPYRELMILVYEGAGEFGCRVRNTGIQKNPKN
jgi:hypothetical protein